jgi:hypothetical protein
MKFVNIKNLPPWGIDLQQIICYRIFVKCNRLQEDKMVRTQIQLSEEQVAMLKKMAKDQHKSMAEIIRQAVDYFGKVRQGRANRQLRNRAMAAVGHFKSGEKDLATSHDSYLNEAFGQ